MQNESVDIFHETCRMVDDDDAQEAQVVALRGMDIDRNLFPSLCLLLRMQSFQSPLFFSFALLPKTMGRLCIASLPDCCVRAFMYGLVNGTFALERPTTNCAS